MFSISRCQLLCMYIIYRMDKQQVLLYSVGKYIQYPVKTIMEKNLRKNIYIYIYVCVCVCVCIHTHIYVYIWLKKVHLGFSILSYRKTQMNFLTNSIYN